MTLMRWKWRTLNCVRGSRELYAAQTKSRTPCLPDYLEIFLVQTLRLACNEGCRFAGDAGSHAYVMCCCKWFRAGIINNVPMFLVFFAWYHHHHQGRTVSFLAGTDEHGLKIQKLLVHGWCLFLIFNLFAYLRDISSRGKGDSRR